MRSNRTSLRRNRIAPRRQRPQTFILQAPQPHKLDVWLPRLANFTQVALLALTACGFYFTVLPLYQKALLDEAFARKEVELKQVTAALDAKYGQLRRVAVREFAIGADADCSGFSEMLRTTRDKPLESHENVEANAFKIDVKKCILDHEKKATSLAELRPDDRAYFRTVLLEVTDRIVKFQSDAAANYARADNDINDSNVNAYASRRQFSARMLAFVSQHMKLPPGFIAAQKRRDAVNELRSERIDAYNKALRTELYGLIKMKWPAH